MSLSRVLAVAEAQVHDVLRRRLALAILILLPVAFYLSVGGETDFGLVAGGIGMAWTVAGAALFLALASRRVDQRLVLAGYRPVEILGGRLLFLEGLTLVLIVIFSALMAALSRPPRPDALVLALALTGLVAVPIGLAIASFFAHELEASLTLIGIVGIEMSLPVDSSLAPFLPLYGPLQVMRVALGGGDVALPVLHALGSALVLFAVAAAIWHRRTRVQRMP
ncbi:MAG: hypothetical protein ACRDGB_10065 [Candidatus Limnocylindria bacterium]